MAKYSLDIDEALRACNGLKEAKKKLDTTQGEIEKLCKEISEKWEGEASRQYISLLLEQKSKVVESASAISSVEDTTRKTINDFEAIDKKISKKEISAKKTSSIIKWLRF